MDAGLSLHVLGGGFSGLRSDSRCPLFTLRSPEGQAMAEASVEVSEGHIQENGQPWMTLVAL